MNIEHRTSNIENASRSGFTLLELLVAISILAMIVLMMSGVFFQSRVAWRSGLRRTRMSQEGRAVVDFMANELSQAVADETLESTINDGDKITFYVLDDTDPKTRAVRQIAYEKSGSTIRRRVSDVGFDPPPYPAPLPETASELARNVEALHFYVPGGGPYTTNLPRWVDIEAQIGVEDRVSRVSVRSSGRDRQWGTDRDVESQ